MMKITISFLFLPVFLLLSDDASAQNTPAPAEAEAYIVNLKDGDIVNSPFKVVFGLSGMGVAPAGTEKENTGHHHLLINSLLEGEDLRQPIPKDAKHIHFGGGQTETILSLDPGKYSLQLILGDKNHYPHVPPILSQVVHVTVIADTDAD